MPQNQHPTEIVVEPVYKSWDHRREHGIASVRPADESDYRLRLEPGDLFVVHEDTNKSDGFGPRSQHSRHLDLGNARRAARGLGVQGSLGSITLEAPTPRDITAFDADGNKITVATTIEYVRVPWEKRIHRVSQQRTR